jgi:SH3-like domain-containing protein
MGVSRFVGFFAVLILLAPLSALAKENGSGLALPRFVALKSDRVNARSGPGMNYPVVWIFTRKNQPVEVLNEFEQWRKVRDADGAEGWVQQSLLTGRRFAVVAGERRTLWSEPDQGSIPLVIAEPGVQGRLLKCEGDWCQLKIDRDTGWMRRDFIWGVYPGEAGK